jgi:DNA-binding response OmpR family regulator
MAKILVIEDEALLRGEIVEWLTFEGYEAISAGNGLAGLEAAFHHRPSTHKIEG